ncbi:Dabb family protein [Rubritalea tangerina]|uniref:Dabb family protein n=1 Tax=Rubritalea tangerina TaxID=430798 RepID=A0ABW4Z6K3_9BACT
MVRHLGFFQFKEGVSDEEIAMCFDELRAMVGQIPGLLSIEHGLHQSDEGLDDGFTHAFCMTFESIAARDAYLPHPVHMQRVELFQPRLERVIVCDFEVQDAFKATV